MAKDLDRYLAREPVIARPIGWSQRRLRWLRNHPVSSAIAVIAGVVLFTLVAVIVVEFRSLQEQAKQIDAVRQEAETYRHALQIAEGKAARLKADMSEDERRPADMP